MSEIQKLPSKPRDMEIGDDAERGYYFARSPVLEARLRVACDHLDWLVREYELDPEISEWAAALREGLDSK